MTNQVRDVRRGDGEVCMRSFIERIVLHILVIPYNPGQTSKWYSLNIPLTEKALVYYQADWLYFPHTMLLSFVIIGRHGLYRCSVFGVAEAYVSFPDAFLVRRMNQKILPARMRGAS